MGPGYEGSLWIISVMSVGIMDQTRTRLVSASAQRFVRVPIGAATPIEPRPLGTHGRR